MSQCTYFDVQVLTPSQSPRLSGNEKDFPDVTLAEEDKEKIYEHKDVLTANSPNLARTFENGRRYL